MGRGTFSLSGLSPPSALRLCHVLIRYSVSICCGRGSVDTQYVTVYNSYQCGHGIWHALNRGVTDG